MTAQPNTPDLTQTTSIPRIGGWLYVVALGLAFTPLRLGSSLLEHYLPAWQKMLADSPLKTLLMAEIAFTAVLFLVSLYLIFLFFKQRKTFSKWYAAIAVITMIFILGDAYIYSLLVPTAQSFMTAQWQEIARAAMTLFIWTPYVLLSKRAKQTFVR